MTNDILQTYIENINVKKLSEYLSLSFSMINDMLQIYIKNINLKKGCEYLLFFSWYD
jgi:hypothetical protein